MTTLSLSTMNQRDHILVFTHPPEKDAARARWTKCHRVAAGRAVLLGRQHAATCGSELKILHRRCCAAKERQWLGPGTEMAPQPDGDWGERLNAAMEEAFDRGAQRVVVMAPRRHTLPPDALAETFSALNEQRLVWEYDSKLECPLVGLHCAARDAHSGIHWKHERLLLALMNTWYGYGVMPPMHPRQTPPMSGDGVTVIIPALNEASCIGRTIARVKEEADEVIVVDGGSRDDTAALAKACGATVLHTAPGRAVQMNAGALAAHHRHLLFLHADTLPPSGFADKIRRALAVRDVVAGSFSLRIDGTSPSFRWVEWGANLRSRRRQLPYGDQGVFTTLRTFEATGGFAPLPLMEDYDWARRVRKLGRVVTLPETSLTSERRWRHLGPWRTTLLNQCVIAAFRLGVNPARLSRWYAAAGRPSSTFVGNKHASGVSHA